MESEITSPSSALLLFEQAPGFLAFLRGPDFVFEVANAGYRRLVGREDIIGKPVREALPEVLDQGYLELLEKVFQTGEAVSGHASRVVLRRTPSGPLIDVYVDFIYQPIRAQDGTVAGVLVTGFDVTEARQREAQYRALFEAIDDGFCILQMIHDDAGKTIDYRFLQLNAAFEKQTGLKNALGRTVREVIPDLDESWFRIYGNVADTGIPTRFENQAPALERKWFETFASRVGAPELRQVALVFKDVTERKRIEADRELQRAHLSSLIDSAPIAIATWRGPTHIYSSANRAYLEMLGRTTDIIGKPLSEIYSEQKAGEAIIAALDEVYRTGVPFVDQEYRVSLEVGGKLQERCFVLHLNPIRDGNGVVDGILECAIDVTELARLRELLEVERDLANLVAALEATSRQTAEDSRGRTEFLLAIAIALGESLELETILRRFVEVIAPNEAAFAAVWDTAGPVPRRIVHAPFNPTLVMTENSPETPASLPIRHVVRTGQTLRIDDYLQWMTDRGEAEAGRAIASLGVRTVLVVPIRRAAAVFAALTVARSRDEGFSDDDVAVFEAAARQAALAYDNGRLFGETMRLRAAAEAATIAKDQFLAHVSHDLRNPLNSILGWSTILRASQQNPVQMARGIDVIERNAKAQVQLIEDLLDVSRIASGKLSLELVVEDARASIETALDAARLAAEAKGVELVVSIENDIGAIAVDADRFRQVIWNLVSNAVKFTPPKGRVLVDATRNTSKLQVVVSDNGDGIAPEFLPRIFASFSQAEAGANRTGGLGLGLAIVKHLVELHGGTVSVASEGLGKGASFTVRLPIRAAVPASAPKSGPRELDGVKILVVDDETDAREVVAAILEAAGATVLMASSADEALELIVRERPRVIVSDVGMPGKDGKVLLRDVRALDERIGGRTPAVALTALVRAKDRIEVLSAGFDAHLAKPIEPAELILVLQRLLGREIPHA